VIRRHSRRYEAVLTSQRWRLLRAEVIRCADYSCACCGRGGVLDVHHTRGYRHLGREQPGELEALCRDCHTALHSSRALVNGGCLRTLFWAVIIAVAIQAMWLVALFVIRSLVVS
jgi:5-methylcytosine-specific restriction endonuclease McrA